MHNSMEESILAPMENSNKIQYAHNTLQSRYHLASANEFNTPTL